MAGNLTLVMRSELKHCMPENSTMNNFGNHGAFIKMSLKAIKKNTLSPNWHGTVKAVLRKKNMRVYISK